MVKMYFFQIPAPIFFFIHISIDCIATQDCCTKPYMKLQRNSEYDIIENYIIDISKYNMLVSILLRI